MPAPLIWLGIGLVTTIAGKVAYDSISSPDNDDDDWEYEKQNAAAKKEQAKQAKKAEEQRCTKSISEGWLNMPKHNCSSWWINTISTIKLMTN